MSSPRDPSDDEEEYIQQRAPRKKGGYDSRIEQILYEREDLQILIIDAGKNHENGGSYIAYTIRTGVRHYRGNISICSNTSRISRFAGGTRSLLL